MHARRAETIALLDQVLEQCGVWTTDDFATIINDEYIVLHLSLQVAAPQ